MAHGPSIFPFLPNPPRNMFSSLFFLPIALSDTLQLVLFLDRVAVAAPLGGVDELLGQALGDALDVAEGGLAGADGEQGNGLIDATQGADVDGLAAHGAGAADPGRVLARAAVDDGVDGDLDRVLVRHDVDLLACWVRLGLGVGVEEGGGGRDGRFQRSGRRCARP